MELSSALLVFIPLVGGYRFARRWNISRVSVAQEDGHKLYFRSAFNGLILFILVYGIYFLGAQIILLCEVFSERSHSSLIFDPTVIWPSQLEFQSVAVISAFSGELFARVINKYGPLFKVYESWKAKMFMEGLQGDPLSTLLYTASTQRMPIAFSMNNGLVFIGYWVASSAPNEKFKWIKILPLASGYRNKKGSMQLRTQYRDIYEAIDKKDNDLDHLKIADFYKVIDQERLVAANLFDVGAFVKFGDFRRNPVVKESPSIKNSPVKRTVSKNPRKKRKGRH